MIDYNQIRNQVQMDATEIAKKVATEVYNKLGTRFGVAKVPYHIHQGLDTAPLDPKFFLGFPIMSAAPTDKPANGTIRLYNSGGTRKIYAFISGTWYSATLT